MKVRRLYSTQADQALGKLYEQAWSAKPFSKTLECQQPLQLGIVGCRVCSVSKKQAMYFPTHERLAQNCVSPALQPTL